MRAAPQTDYEKQVEVSPKYDTQLLYPLEGTQAVTVTTGGGQMVTFDLPAVPYNLSRSYISLLATPAGGTNYNYWFLNNIPFRTVQLYTKSGLYIADIQYCNYVTDIILPATIPFEEYSNFARGLTDNTANANYHSNIFKNNTATLGIAGAGDQRQVRFGNAGAGTGSSQMVNETAYSIVGGNTTATPLVYLHIPLGLLKHSIFALDKDLYFGSDQLQLRFTFDNSTQYVFNATDPTGNTTGAAAATTISMSSVKLYLATERNEEIVNALKAKYLSGGYSILTDYPHIFMRNLTTGNQVIQLRVNRSHGKYLKKIFHAPFDNDTGNFWDVYNRSNIGQVIITSFYTTLDNMRLQNFNVTCSAMEDFLLLKPRLAGSLILDSNIYQYKNFWCDDWSGVEKLVDDGGKEQVENGLPLDGREYLWAYNGTTAGNALNHYSVVVCSRELAITPSGIMFV